MSRPREPIRTRRLVLDPIRHDHDAGLQEAIERSRPELLPWMPWAARHRLEDQRNFTSMALVAWERDREFHFALLEESPIGVMGLRRREGTQEYEIGYWIDSTKAGRGYATEAARALLELAFGDFAADAVILKAGASNRGSTRVAEKLGFIPVGSEQMEGGLGSFQANVHRLTRDQFERSGKLAEHTSPSS